MDGRGARRRTVVTALTLGLATLALALPAVAAAQSAGDDQYADPLAGDRPSQSPRSGGGGQTQPDAPAPAPVPTPAPNPAPAPAPPSDGGTAGATGADTQSTAPTTSATGTLPRTGAEPAPLAAAGLLLALAGILLRRRTPLRARP